MNKFPVFSLLIREFDAESSSHQTGSSSKEAVTIGAPHPERELMRLRSRQPGSEPESEPFFLRVETSPPEFGKSAATEPSPVRIRPPNRPSTRPFAAISGM